MNANMPEFAPSFDAAPVSGDCKFIAEHRLEAVLALVSSTVPVSGSRASAVGVG